MPTTLGPTAAASAMVTAFICSSAKRHTVYVARTVHKSTRGPASPVSLAALAKRPGSRTKRGQPPQSNLTAVVHSDAQDNLRRCSR